jgi:hypothetical protein
MKTIHNPNEAAIVELTRIHRLAAANALASLKVMTETQDAIDRLTKYQREYGEVDIRGLFERLKSGTGMSA